MGTKENMKQAMRELMGGVGEKKDLEESERAAPKDDCAQAVSRTVEKILDESRYSASEKVPNQKAEPSCCKSGDERKPGKEGERTVIAEGSCIFGNIQSEGSIDFRGVLKGDLTATGEIMLAGRIQGNVCGQRITMCASTVQGNVTANDLIDVDEESVLIGDAQADSLTTNGKQKGNIHVEKMLKLQEKAVLVGDVTAGQVSMAAGAKVQGGIVVSQRDMQMPEFTDLDI